MNIYTQTQLAALPDLLMYRRTELYAEVRAAQAAARERAGDVDDLKDISARVASSEVQFAEESRDRTELAQVEAALKRVDAGLYGDCLECGEPISLQRLLVQAAAERCATCQSAVEKQRGH